MSMQLPINEYQVAALSAPPSDPANIQFLRPMATLRICRSHWLLSKRNLPSSRKRLRAFHWRMT